MEQLLKRRQAHHLLLRHHRYRVLLNFLRYFVQFEVDEHEDAKQRKTIAFLYRCFLFLFCCCCHFSTAGSHTNGSLKMLESGQKKLDKILKFSAHCSRSFAKPDQEDSRIATFPTITAYLTTETLMTEIVQCGFYGRHTKPQL